MDFSFFYVFCLCFFNILLLVLLCFCLLVSRFFFSSFPCISTRYYDKIFLSGSLLVITCFFPMSKSYSVYSYIDYFVLTKNSSLLCVLCCSCSVVPKSAIALRRYAWHMKILNIKNYYSSYYSRTRPSTLLKKPDTGVFLKTHFYIELLEAISGFCSWQLEGKHL